MVKKNETIRIAVADDHTLFRKGLVKLIQSLGDEYSVLIEAGNGDELITQLRSTNNISIALIDVNMPQKDGFETVRYLHEHHPDIRILIVSMIDKEESVVRMLKLGVKGYLSKDVEPQDMKTAINAVLEKGYYYTDFVTGRLVHDLQKKDGMYQDENLTNREREFLQYACSELTYKEVADKMHLSVKTVDGFRDSLFRKFATASRVGLVIHAIKKGLVQL